MKDERETKEKLLQSARAEFLAKGYQGASLRSICKASGVTTGALYFFFKDKDDLFTSLVAPQLNTLKAMLTEHMRQELLVLDSGEDAAENDFRDDAYASQQVLHLLYQNYDLFLLLLTGSYGSSLEHFVDELVAISEEHYRKLADPAAGLHHPLAGPHADRRLCAPAHPRAGRAEGPDPPAGHPAVYAQRLERPVPAPRQPRPLNLPLFPWRICCVMVFISPFT